MFPLSTPRFLKLLYKRPFSPLLEKREICALQDERALCGLTPWSSCCRQPARSRGLPRSSQGTSVPPRAQPGSPSAPIPGRRGSGWRLLAQAPGAFLGAPLIGILRLPISGVQGDPQVSWGFNQHCLCRPFPLSCPLAGNYGGHTPV